MKYIYLPILLLIFLNAPAQKLITDQKDEFTGKQVKRTSWETIGSKGSLTGYTFYIQFSKVDTTSFLKFRTMYSGYKRLLVNQGDDLMLKMSDSSVVTLKSSEFKTATYGGGATGLGGSKALGMVVDYAIDGNALKTLSTGQVVKIRWYTSDGFIEIELKTRNAEKIGELAKLIL